jgi:sulfonate transport system ATP-binding protein
MSEAKNKVEVINLRKCFGDLVVLDNCNFNVEEGDFICVVGPTGCGKTTFLNLLTCLIEPTSGQILIDGKPADPKVHDIAFVFQEPSLFPWKTVEQNLRYGLKIKKKPESFIKSQVEKVISLMGLEKYRDCYPSQLSVSCAQKTVIGRAFAMNPDILLMDEPYAQLDVKMRFYLEDEVIRLWKELHSTVIFITHNIEEAVYLANRILIMDNKPSKVKEEVLIDLPRPRNVYSKEFIDIRSYVTEKIRWW